MIGLGIPGSLIRAYYLAFFLVSWLKFFLLNLSLSMLAISRWHHSFRKHLPTEWLSLLAQNISFLVLRFNLGLKSHTLTMSYPWWVPYSVLASLPFSYFLQLINQISLSSRQYCFRCIFDTFVYVCPELKGPVGLLVLSCPLLLLTVLPWIIVWWREIIYKWVHFESFLWLPPLVLRSTSLLPKEETQSYKLVQLLKYRTYNITYSRSLENSQ